MQVLVTGAGGFIGHHLVNYLVGHGYRVRGVDLKYPLFAPSRAHDFEILDLRRRDSCLIATRGISEVYHLTADMGGIGYISSHHAEIATNNLLIDSHMLDASRINGISRFLYASSACVYPLYRQRVPAVAPLKEEDASPAEPEEGYGWEKLFAEKLCQYYGEDYDVETRVVRFHNVYGPFGTYDGGREKAPAAICRKVALAEDEGEIEIWGNGDQTRSFMYVDDCVEGIHRIMRAGYGKPLNLGTDRLVSISELVDIIARIAGKTIHKIFDSTKPQGVLGRNSDNTRLQQVLGWVPSISLEEGLPRTYRWIESELRKAGRLHRVKPEDPAIA